MGYPSHWLICFKMVKTTNQPMTFQKPPNKKKPGNNSWNKTQYFVLRITLAGKEQLVVNGNWANSTFESFSSAPSWLMFLYLRLCNIRRFSFTNMLGSESSNATTQNHYLVTWWMVVASSGLPKHHRFQKKKWFHKMVPPLGYQVVYNPYYHMT